MRKLLASCLVASQVIAGTVASAQSPTASNSSPASSPAATAESPLAETVRPLARPADALAESLAAQPTSMLVAEVLERNPEIARARQLAAAAAARAPRVGALPDPVAALNIFVLPPETRTGPQRFSVSLQQQLPWFGKLKLREQAALLAAAAAEADVETIRLDQLTAARTLAFELAFLDAYQAIVAAERSALVRYERAAQARYAAGTGLQQEIVRIQVQITRSDTRLLEIAEHRASLASRVNQLRDRPADAAVGRFDLFFVEQSTFKRARLLEAALANRPELASIDAHIAAGHSLVALAEKSFRPDVTVGLSYTAVGSRQDSAGRLSPPEDEGDDILSLSGSVHLPVWRRKLEAGVQEASARRWATELEKRTIEAQVESTIGDLTARMPLLAEHLKLLDTVLLKQAREALRSAETAYSTGKLNAVDLLDAEVVLFEVQIAAERTRTDLAVAWAQLERAVAQPLNSLPMGLANERNER